MKFKDTELATLYVMREGMDEEVRLTYYVRRAGEAQGRYVPAARLACVQGLPWRRG